MQSKPYKIIQLQDQYVSNNHQYPFIESVKQKIRFRLRSKLCYDHQPILLLEKPENFDYPLPLKGNINVNQTKTTQNYKVLSGQLTKDGAWQCDLPQTLPGVVSFQLVFVSSGSHFTSRLGTCDTILLCQEKLDLRKLRKMSVFPRCIGQWSLWSTFFRSQKSLGYNAFHFAPIQETGGSNSYYSLKSHIQLSSQLFEGTKKQKETHLERILSPLKQEGMTFFIDIVLNHTSFDSQWIKQSSDCVFTVQNTPMLYPAYVVDNVIYEWGEQVKQLIKQKKFTLDIPYKQIEQNLKSKILSLKIYDYFQLSPELQSKMVYLLPANTNSQEKSSQFAVQAILNFLHKNVTMPNQNPYGIILQNQEQWVNCKITYSIIDLKQAIEAFNQHWKNKIVQKWIPEMIENTINYIKVSYFVTKERSFSDPYPLALAYFTKVDGKEGDFYALNNGWVGGDFDSRQLFVTSRQHYYFRRRINSWGDLLRLRYGNQPADSPLVWQHMLEYVRQMARQFDGFRMDNLHGSPLNAAKYLIRQARKVNPNLVVFAELFTNSDAETATFVREVGLDSTLLEAQDFLSGQEFVKNFDQEINTVNPNLGSISRLFKQNGQFIQYASRKKPISLVYDITHDHLTFITRKKTILHTPLAFLLPMIGTFTGSTKGFDQFYTNKILVTELRDLYQNDKKYPPLIEKAQTQTTLITYSGKQKCSLFGNWNNWKQPTELISDQKTHIQYAYLDLPPGAYEYKFTGDNRWILENGRNHNGENHTLTVTKNDFTRKIYRNLQSLRLSISEKADKFFKFIEFHVQNIGDIIIVIRQPPDHTESICTILNISTENSYLHNGIELFGNVAQSELWVQSSLSVDEQYTTRTEVSYTTNIHEYFQVSVNQTTGNDILKAVFIPPGFACFIHCKKNQAVRKTIYLAQQITSKTPFLPHQLSPFEINRLFFSSIHEQRYLWGQEPFFIPQSNNQLVYAGFAGVFDLILRAKKTGDLNASLFQNLRQGNWLLDYFVNRVKRQKKLEFFQIYLQNVFNHFKILPKYLLPKYFADFIYKLMNTTKQRFQGDCDFQKQLAFASCQFINYFPKIQLKDKTIFSASLSHYALGHGRRFGRDTFISSEILKFFPKLFKDTILYFASIMRHGLIPNFIDQHNWPRFKNRDTCWWFLKAIIDYIEVTNDYKILKSKIQMIFVSSDKDQHFKRKHQGEKKMLLLEDVAQQIFQMHSTGINFREWEAGDQLDSNIHSEGFNINLYTDPETGFIMGGNPHNSLTWMDKMGTSERAGTNALPATPRAGSPIQLVGLLYFALTKFEQLNSKGYFSNNGVDFQGKFMKFGQWADKIKQNFQSHYFLEYLQPHQHHYAAGIYKDLIGSPIPQDQTKFRPNSLISLTLAPQLFTPSKARNHIKKVEKDLLHPKSIGVSTLADMYPPYTSFYDLYNDSNDYKIAHGFSHHNGPEWVWLYGFYLGAKINFQSQEINKPKMMTLLQEHIKYLQRSQWQSLPELTNRNGSPNNFCSKAQAWSVSTILMALRKIRKLSG